MTPTRTRTQKSAATDASELEITIEIAVEHAKRAFALKKFEQAVEHYATALELMQVASIFVARIR
jgi:HAT1-interacting factor 1